jgi:hypothetical protein
MIINRTQGLSAAMRMPPARVDQSTANDGLGAGGGQGGGSPSAEARARVALARAAVDRINTSISNSTTANVNDTDFIARALTTILGDLDTIEATAATDLAAANKSRETLAATDGITIDDLQKKLADCKLKSGGNTGTSIESGTSGGASSSKTVSTVGAVSIGAGGLAVGAAAGFFAGRMLKR